LVLPITPGGLGITELGLPVRVIIPAADLACSGSRAITFPICGHPGEHLVSHDAVREQGPQRGDAGCLCIWPGRGPAARKNTAQVNAIQFLATMNTLP
jgi:hypothetical protein